MATLDENERRGRDENESIFLSGWQQQIKDDFRYTQFTESKDRYWELFNKKHPQTEEPRLKDPIAKRDAMKEKRGVAFFKKSCTQMMENLLPYLVRYNLESVLNLCGAPGGFCHPLLQQDARTHIDLFTLPEETGGIPMAIPPDPRISINKLGKEFGDVVKLAFWVKGKIFFSFS